MTEPSRLLILISTSDHPKGYLTKITTDYEAKHDEELSVQKGTMVKVSLRPLSSHFFKL